MNTAQNSDDDKSRYLHETTFVVLDLETTGASPKIGAGITEIGAVKESGGESGSSKHSLILKNRSLHT